MDWRLERLLGVDVEEDEDHASSATSTAAVAVAASSSPKAAKSVRRVSFLVDDFQDTPQSPPPSSDRRMSLANLSDGEQRRELLRRLSNTDLEEERLMKEGRRGVLDETIKLHEEEYGEYSSKKVETLSQVLREMVDAQKVAWGDREELVKDHTVTGSQLQDLRKECDHWRSEADRLWGITKT